MAYHASFQHIVFATKDRFRVLLKEQRRFIFNCMKDEIIRLKCTPIILNGVTDHVHILCKVRPSITIAYLVKNIKIASSIYIKRELDLPEFYGWQLGYACFSVNYKDFQRLYDYIRNQESHHRKNYGIEELQG